MVIIKKLNMAGVPHASCFDEPVLRQIQRPLLLGFALGKSRERKQADRADGRKFYHAT